MAPAPTTSAQTSVQRDVAVDVRELGKRFGEFTAVDGVSFSVDPGELFGFLGPNGAGKTTTISMLCTLLAPTSGTAVVAGHDIVRDPHGVRTNIGLVFQETTLDDLLTAEQNLRFHGVLYGVPEAEVVRRMAPLLEMVGLADRADQRVQMYSGGMKRRLEIARGLLHAPRVLFLDEPTIGLDPQTRAHIWEYVDTLRHREATTMFLTTHYMDEAERCDRIAIIDNGRIVAIDTPASLKASVGADTVEVTAADAGSLRDQIASSLQVAGEVTPDGLVRFLVPEGASFVPRIFEHGTGIESVNVRRPTLDDVFIKYTGHAIRDAEAGAGDKFRMNPMVRGFRRG
ncbi:MAG TPA: ATP-binding cassette domain-containing protein [Acidimicrobiia bacterium]|nr:ATP-binding cassette domain-containing protein [Acidimicrobiia bacterium]